MSERAPILFVIAAPSGTGKSSLLGRLLAEVERLSFSVSHTTRAPRPGETDGVQYRFVDAPTFRELVRAERLLEWAEVHGQLYGTALAEPERAERDGVDLVLDLDVQGAAQVRARRRGAVTVFLLPPSAREMERRLRGRGQDSAESIARRLADARREVGCWEDFDFVLINDDLERALSDLKAVVRAERLRRGRMAAAARRVAATFDSSPREESRCR